MIVLISCSERTNQGRSPDPSAAQVNFKWYEAQYSLAKYKEMQPGRPIIALFVHKWDVPTAFKVLRDSDVISRLQRENFLCLTYESTNDQSLGAQEMRRLEHRSFPLIFASIPHRGDFLHEPPYSEPAAREVVNKIILEAEQGRTSDGG
ncbi:MAG: hypothetical protein MUF31_09880 [Akkermansiaceae bacterium]|jgi:hypothetical protein|nr:hypothetical protein [Akkermansiaceae bacterium]